MRQIQYNFVFFMVFMLSGCALMQGVNPVVKTTPAERLAEVDGYITAAINTAADLRAGGIIDNKLYKKIDVQIDHVNAALDAAWIAIGIGDLSTAEAQIKLINDILWELRKLTPKPTGDP